MTDSNIVLSVKLTPTSWAAVQRAAGTTGDTRTDTMNRAVQVYDRLAAAVDKGARVFVQWPDRDETVDLSGATP